MFMSPDVMCWIFGHRPGKLIGTGQVIVTEKRNKKQRPINGKWDVFKCERCGDDCAYEALKGINETPTIQK